MTEHADRADQDQQPTNDDDGTASSIEVIDARQSSAIPPHIREIIEAHLAIEREDAKAAGALGFMTRGLAMATMPHRNPNTEIFVRKNGDFTLRMMAGSSAGLPYGSLPRLLVSWVCTEAVQTQSQTLQLGESLSQFLKELNLSRGGGPRGSATRVREQMRRLFGSAITAEYQGSAVEKGVKKDGFRIKNLTLLEDSEVWWSPKVGDQEEEWSGQLVLSPKFFQECIEGPIPIDKRAYQALSDSPLALDIYTWLTYRMSYLSQKSRPIRWEALQAQFGSNYGNDDQGLRNFRKAFLRSLSKVLLIYPKARVEQAANGMVLFPSPPHIAKAEKSIFGPPTTSTSVVIKGRQGKLF